jgi:putative membrane protein
MFGTGGFLTEHMAGHILAMNVAAPVLVLTTRRLAPHIGADWLPHSIGLAAACQIALLGVWHLPVAVAFAAASAAGMAAMHLSLLLAALWFWACVVDEADESRWRSLGALLITGKLFCLLGVLLVLAPRPIYAEAVRIHAGAGHVPLGHMLPDQQLAGLLMLVACPLTYVLAGVVIAARWIAEIDRRPSWTSPEAGA